MKHIVVTGGAGFIGSHTVTELQQAGFAVTVLDNFCNSERSVLDRIAQITGQRPALAELDLTDRDAVFSFFAFADADAVIHFGGLKAVGESCLQPLRYFHNNLTGTVNLLDAMDAAGCRKIVFSSSATVYGDKNPVPFVETMPTGAANPYGRTKRVIEEMLSDLTASDPAWSAAALRYFNPIGAHPSGLIGENPHGIPDNLVPYIAKVACGELPALRVFGNDYDTPDGTCLRDYIHVCDLAKGHLCAMRYLETHTGFETVNLGTGRSASVLEVLHAYEAACGRTLPYVIAPRRPGDIPRMQADVRKAKKLLGWSAEADLVTMCRDSWNYTKKYWKGGEQNAADRCEGLSEG